MKEPKNIRVVIIPVGELGRRDLENIENTVFNSEAHIMRALFHKHSQRENAFTLNPKVLTAAEFRKEIAFNKASKPFNQAMLNVRKRNQCYKLTDFMNDFNDQEFGDETDSYWMGYVRVKR